jgi:hypothetical protein
MALLATRRILIDEHWNKNFGMVTVVDVHAMEWWCDLVMKSRVRNEKQLWKQLWKTMMTEVVSV